MYYVAHMDVPDRECHAMKDPRYCMSTPPEKNDRAEWPESFGPEYHCPLSINQREQSEGDDWDSVCCWSSNVFVQSVTHAKSSWCDAQCLRHNVLLVQQTFYGVLI